MTQIYLIAKRTKEEEEEQKPEMLIYEWPNNRQNVLLFLINAFLSIQMDKKAMSSSRMLFLLEDIALPFMGSQRDVTV